MKDRNKWLAPAFAGILLLSLAGCGGSAGTSKNTPPAVHNEWTWVNGSNKTDQPGRYGKQGTADPNNVPAARAYPASWTDPSGNFWLFGGYGTDPTDGSDGWHNDLWRYSNGEWTWGERVNPNRPTGNLWNNGGRITRQYPRGARFLSQLGRSFRESLALWRDGY